MSSFCLTLVVYFAFVLGSSSSRAASPRSFYPSSTVLTKGKNSSDYDSFILSATQIHFSPAIPYENPPKVLPLRAQTHDSSNGLINPIYSKLKPFRSSYMEINFYPELSEDQESQFLDIFNELFDGEKKIRDAQRGELWANPEALEFIMKKALSQPRSGLNEEKEIVGMYIFKKFGAAGLITYLQPFYDGVPVRRDGVKLLEGSGVNIIGILPGIHWETKLDRPVVIGAHWDTVKESNGFGDNGSGVGSLLEIVRALTSSKCYENKESVIFVAFDSEEDGSFGSLEFIRSFIKPYFYDKGIHIRGSYILDNINNFDDTPGSQNIPEEWEKYATKNAESVKTNEKRGDFISIVHRDLKEERELGRVFEKYMSLVKGIGAYPRVERLKIELPFMELPDLETLSNGMKFLRSDHSRFWYYVENTTFLSFPSALITDTGFNRGYMQKCYHQKCDSHENPNIHPKSYQFLANVTQALIYSVFELTEGSFESCELPYSKEPSLPATLSSNGAQSDLVETQNSFMNYLAHPPNVPRGSPYFFGSYQPSFGNQYNIGSLIIKVNEKELQNKPNSTERPPVFPSEAITKIKSFFKGRNSPIVLLLNN